MRMKFPILTLTIPEMHVIMDALHTLHANPMTGLGCATTCVEDCDECEAAELYQRFREHIKEQQDE